MDEKTYSTLWADQRTEPKAHVPTSSSLHSSPLHGPHPVGFHSALKKPRNSGCRRKRGAVMSFYGRYIRVCASSTHMQQEFRFPTSGAALGWHLASGLERTLLERQKKGKFKVFSYLRADKFPWAIAGTHRAKVEGTFKLWATWLEPYRACPSVKCSIHKCQQKCTYDLCYSQVVYFSYLFNDSFAHLL